MKKIFCIINALLLLSITDGNAQKEKSVPGYLGKRNCLGLYGTFNLTTTKDFQNQIVQPEAGFEYEKVMNRRGAYVFSAGIRNGTMDKYSLKPEEREHKFLSVIDGNKTYTLSEEDGRQSYSCNSISLSRVYYMLGRGAIAPQGKYLRLGVTWMFYKLKSDDMNYSYYNNFNQKIQVNNQDQDFKSMNKGFFAFELGSRRFFGNSVYFRKSLSVNIPFDFWADLGVREYNRITDYQEDMLHQYISNMNVLRLNLAIGIAL